MTNYVSSKIIKIALYYDLYHILNNSRNSTDTYDQKEAFHIN